MHLSLQWLLHMQPCLDKSPEQYSRFYILLLYTDNHNILSNLYLLYVMVHLYHTQLHLVLQYLSEQQAKHHLPIHQKRLEQANVLT